MSSEAKLEELRKNKFTRVERINRFFESIKHEDEREKLLADIKAMDDNELKQILTEIFEDKFYYMNKTKDGAKKTTKGKKSKKSKKPKRGGKKRTRRR